MSRHQLLVLVALVLTGFAVAQILRSTRSLGRAVDPTLVTRISGETSFPESVVGRGDVKVIIFTDYQCPACRKADPALRQAAVRDGNIRIVYRDWPIFGERSVRAAEIALAADKQGIYPALHHRLMNARSFNEAALQEAVEAVGGNWGQVEADLDSHAEEIRGQIRSNGLDAVALGMRGTPGYLIGSQVIEGALTEGEFLRAFGQARSVS